MGIARLKRLVAEDLYRSFTTSELQKILLEIDSKVNLYSLTGYPENANIPRKEASVQILDYFHKINALPIFLSMYMDMSERGYRGEKPIFHNIKLVKKEFEECGYSYNEALKRIVTKDNDSNDWGYLEDGKTYNFCFVSVDICSNSRLIVTYPQEVVRETYSMFKKFVQNFAKKRDGLVWNWEGDGGIVVFHLGDTVNQAVFFAIDLLESMPIFNATLNYINGEDIRIRAGIHAGSAEFKNDTALINSDSIEKVKVVEKKMTSPLSISITQSSFSNVNRILRDYFTPQDFNGETVYKYEFSIHSGVHN